MSEHCPPCCHTLSMPRIRRLAGYSIAAELAVAGCIALPESSKADDGLHALLIATLLGVLAWLRSGALD